MPTKKDSSQAAATAQAAFITKIGTERLRIPIVGTSPLIVHRWSEKAKLELLESQQGKKKAKEPRDPQAEYEASLYRMALEKGGEGFGFPSLAFKSAVVETFRFFDKSVTKVLLMQSVFVHGILTKADPAPLIPLTGEPVLREDVVRIGMNGTQTRYRGEFTEWSAVLDLTYVTATLDRDSLLSLVDAAGMFVGVGEWRPEKAGESGTFALQEADIEIVKTPWQRGAVTTAPAK
jgi:hypothetical protein